MIWAWAPGVENLVLPKDVGFRIGNGSLPILELGIHFNNPGLVSGLFDRSGIRIYYNTNLRKFDAGVLFLGDGVVTQIGGVEPGDGYKEYEYDCCSNCSARWGHNLNVFASFLHMHQVGSQAWSTLYREEKKIMEINRIDYYNFGMQQQTPKNIVLQPGDRINTHCVYKRDPSRTVVFGEASSDEMCINFLSYYPKISQKSPMCGYWADRRNQNTSKTNFTNCHGERTLINPTVREPPGGTFKWFGSTNDVNYACVVSPAKTQIVFEETKEEKFGMQQIIITVITLTLITFVGIVFTFRGRISSSCNNKKPENFFEDDKVESSLV